MAFSDIISSIFGGTDDSAQEGQKAQNAENAAYNKQQTEAAKRFIFSGAPSMYSNFNEAGDRALQTLKGSAAPVMESYRMGNQNAQQTIGQGLNQTISALLGTPIDTGFTQPRNVSTQGMSDLMNQPFTGYPGYSSSIGLINQNEQAQGFNQPQQAQMIQQLLNPYGAFGRRGLMQ